MIRLSGSLTKGDAFRPETMGLNLEERNSTASFTLPIGESFTVGEWLMDDNDPGAGIVWRVKTVDRQYDKNTQTVTLEHMIAALKDRIMFGDVDPKTITGSSSATTCTALETIQYILNQQSDWVLDTASFDYGSVSNPYNFSSESLFGALETVSSSLEDCIWEYDFTTYPFKLKIRQLSSDVASEMRMSRNITTMKVTVDRSGMYTRFYPIGKNNLKLSGGGYVSKNESTWGVVSKVETDQSKTTAAELTAWANERLSRHAEPLVTVTISGLDLSASTGESLDSFVIGKKCRAPLPEYGTTVTERVTKLSWRDKLNQREVVNITLANKLADVATILKNQAASSSRAGRTGAKKAGEDHAWIVDADDHITLVAEAVAGKDGTGKPNWSRVSQLTVDGNGIDARVTVTENDLVTHWSHITQTESDITAEVTRATGAESTLSGRVQTNADRVALVVEQKDGQNVIKAASIVTAINAQDGESTIRLNADKVYIGGTTKISDVFTVTSGHVSTNGTIYVGSSNAQIKLDVDGQDGVVETDKLKVRTSGSIDLKGVTDYSITNAILSTMVKTVSVSNNVLTLTRFDGTYETFSRAASLTPSWSSGNFPLTITATAGVDFDIGFGSYGTHDLDLELTANGSVRYDSAHAAQIYCPVKISSLNSGQTAPTQRYNKEVVFSDSNFVAGNIRNGVSIFGLTGSYTATAPHVITQFNTTAEEGWSTYYDGHTYTNNSSGYALNGTGRNKTAVITVRGHWLCDGAVRYTDGTNNKNFLTGAPTALYKKGWDDGKAGGYGKSVTLTYKGSVDGVYTYTTSTYVSGLTSGSRYTMHFDT